MTQHTKGPWSHDSKGVIYGNGCTLAQVGSSALIIAKGEDLANARLIAAAPELLAALEACVADGFLAGEVLDEATDAIKKAKGE